MSDLSPFLSFLFLSCSLCGIISLSSVSITFSLPFLLPHSALYYRRTSQVSSSEHSLAFPQGLCHSLFIPTYLHAILFGMKIIIALVMLIFLIISPISHCLSSHSVVFASHPLLCDYARLFPRSHVSLHLSEDITQASKNVCWFLCRRSFSEECSLSRLLCNCFSCFQWQFFFFWLLIFEWKNQKWVSDSPTGSRVCTFYLVLLIGHLGNDGIFSDL